MDDCFLSLNFPYVVCWLVRFAKSLRDLCFTVTEYINDNEVQADRIYQSFNQILIITYGNCVANTNKRHTKLSMVSSDCKINMKILMVAPILFLVILGDGKLIYIREDLAGKYSINQQNLRSGTIFVLPSE